jgi:hypothetical protein
MICVIRCFALCSCGNSPPICIGLWFYYVSSNLIHRVWPASVLIGALLPSATYQGQ